jgi:hypothetical protein
MTYYSGLAHLAPVSSVAVASMRFTFSANNALPLRIFFRTEIPVALLRKLSARISYVVGQSDVRPWH